MHICTFAHYHYLYAMLKWHKILGLLVLTALFSFENKNNPNPMKIIQGDQVFFLIEEVNRMNLNRSEFSFVFPLKASTPEEEHSIKVACFLYEQDANAIHHGQKLSEIPSFAAEAEFAGPKSPYPALYLYQDGYHLLSYQTASNGIHRGQYISTLADGELLLEWKITAVREENNEHQDIAFQNWTNKKLCLVIVQDHNQNGIIDKGELHKAYITFP
jgi:hypothetical protein